MTSRISGPIPSHDVYLSSRNSLCSSRGIHKGSIGLSDGRFSGSMNALNVLQWQSNASSTEASSSPQNTGQPVKNHIRENIRRLRQLQAMPPAKRVPFSQPYKVSSDDSPVVDAQQPQRPYTAIPQFPQKFSRVKTNSSTDTTTIPWPVDHGEGPPYDSMDDPTYPECHRPVDPDPLSRQKSRPCSPDQQTASRNASIGVQCRGIQCSIERRIPSGPQFIQSKGVQVAPKIDQPTQTGDSDLVSDASYYNEEAQERKEVNVKSNIVEKEVGENMDEMENEEKSQNAVHPKLEHVGVSARASHRQRRAISAGPHRHEFMRAHTKTTDGEWNLKILSSMPIRKITRSPRPEKLTVPKASSAKYVRLIRRDIDFVRANAHLATMANLRAQRGYRTPSASAQPSPLVEDPSRPGSSQAGGDIHGQMWPQRRLPVGTLPTYLIRRRQEQREAAAKAAANRPDPDQPPGHQKMSDSERRDTLKLLQKAHKELSDEWAHLPIRMDTLRIRNRRTELEQRLADLEQAISIFSKPKVFIKPE